MILTHSVKVCLATEPCDLRKSFDSLSVIVREQLREDPLSRKVFVFLNKAGNRIKLLYWDGTGLWVMAKRLVAHCSHLLFSEDPLSVPPGLR
jgi:transposase